MDADSDTGLTDWCEWFPYDEAFPEQASAIEQAIETLQERGFFIYEGACGTGKTLAALSAVRTMVDSSATPYKRVLVLTSVRQQTRAFEDDIEAMNDARPNGEDPISALTLVGKQHLCPYVHADRQQIDTDWFYSRCDNLRGPIRDVIDDQGSVHEARPILQDRVSVAEADIERDDALRGENEAGEWVSPYQPSIPEEYRTTGDDVPYCPFYAQYRMSYSGDSSYQPHGVVRPWDMMQEGVGEGVCPHAAMTTGIEEADILIGNYKHAFHPLTVTTLTGSIINEETLLIVDEAHGLVEGVREELSEEVAVSTIRGGYRELYNQVLNREDKAGEIIRRHVEDTVGIERVQDVHEFLSELVDRLDQLAVDELDSTQLDWHNRSHDELPDSVTRSLRDPERPQRDDLTTWIGMADYEHELATLSETLDAVEAAYHLADEDEGTAFTAPDTDLGTIGRVLNRWYSCGHSTYFRQFELEKRRRESSKQGYRGNYTGKLQLQNCIPSSEIASRLADFGGGVLMSATLSPISMFSSVTGLDELEEEQGRVVDEAVYGLRFAEENRESLAINLPKFTRRNRGSPPARANSQQQDLRDNYYEAVRSIVTTTPGNVLVALPNYEESSWMGTCLGNDPDVTKAVLPDGPDVDSEQLRRRFTSGQPKVLTTGLRGTLTEGVDYEGDDLAACAVIGVPLRSLSGEYTDAIRTAYADRFGGDDAFDYAFTLPAVHKARQAIGRVIRGVDEVGVRVFIDKRYAQNREWDDVRGFLPPDEREEFEGISPQDLESRLLRFWDSH